MEKDRLNFCRLSVANQFLWKSTMGLRYLVGTIKISCCGGRWKLSDQKLGGHTLHKGLKFGPPHIWSQLESKAWTILLLHSSLISLRTVAVRAMNLYKVAFSPKGSSCEELVIKSGQNILTEAGISLTQTLVLIYFFQRIPVATPDSHPWKRNRSHGYKRHK